MQSLSLDSKKRMSNQRIDGWFEEFGDDVYLSYSGGKDSTVCLELVAQYCKMNGYKLHVAFCDTGLEYPEIRKCQRDMTGNITRRQTSRLRMTIDVRFRIFQHGLNGRDETVPGQIF